MTRNYAQENVSLCMQWRYMGE